MSEATVTIEVSHYCSECSKLISVRPFELDRRMLTKVLEDGQEAVWEAAEEQTIETGVDAFWQKEAGCTECKPHI